MSRIIRGKGKKYIQEQKALAKKGKRKCLTCGEVKSLDDFTETYKKVDGGVGHLPDCKVCRRKDPSREENVSFVKKNRRLAKRGVKICTNCEQKKDLSEFHLNGEKDDGTPKYKAFCIKCRSETKK